MHKIEISKLKMDYIKPKQVQSTNSWHFVAYLTNAEALFAPFLKSPCTNSFHDGDFWQLILDPRASYGSEKVLD